MGYPGKIKFPIISNHFGKCDHKCELSAVFSAIYYLNFPIETCMCTVLKPLYYHAVNTAI